MSQSSLDEFVYGVAERLGIIRAAPEALDFLLRCGVSGTSGRRNAYSDVAPGPLPIEFSFSQRSEAELRVLAEPCLPGEGILARTVLGVSAVGDMVGASFSSELVDHAQQLVRALLPNGEEIAHLNWRSSVWLALRTTGERSVARIYVNAQLRDAPDRWHRMGRALSACGLEESMVAVIRLRDAAGELVQPIGLCFDLRSSGLTPTRVHCITEKIPPFWLLRLLAATNNQAAIEDATDFMDIFGLLERRGDCPVLVSLGLGQGDVGSLKIDVDLPSLELDAEARHGAQYLAQAEARFGEIAGYHAVSRAFDSVEPRYIGITITPASRFITVYFPCPPLSPANFPHRPSEALEKARSFLRAQFESADALLMDARSSRSVRVVPSGWRDLYMTCLIIQEYSPVLSLGIDVLERSRSYVRAVREGWCWRYLPELPCDLDDTAMALAVLGPADCGISDEVVGHLIATVNQDGGFPTFIGDAPQRQSSHPAVTLNVVFAMDRANISWPQAATEQYLHRWLQKPDFPACEWMGSPLFPIFLCARNTRLLERLGESARQRMVSRVIGMRRADGTWGGELPDSLDTALAVLSLDRLGVPIPNRDVLGYFLLELQHDDGGWGWSPLYSDGSGTWFGHRAITTAFALRALDLLNIR